MSIHIDTFKDEIERTFRVLGADRGFSQNVTDICAWLREGILTDDEYSYLRKYNRKIYSELPLDA